MTTPTDATWCPSCRSEWWNGATSCPDCGDALVAELPQPVDGSPGDRGGPDLRNHELFEYDLGALDPAERWQISLLLDADGIAHEWVGAVLRAPEEAADVIATLEPVERDPGASDGLEEPGPREPRPALPGSIPARLAAAFLDFVLVYIVLITISFSWTDVTVEGNVTTERTTAAATVLVLVLRAAYSIVGIGRWGTTVGKRLAGLRVVALGGDRAGWGRSIVRFVVADLGWMIGWFTPASWQPATSWISLALVVSVYGSILVNPSRRGLHDLVAGTIVQERRPRFG